MVSSHSRHSVPTRRRRGLLITVVALLAGLLPALPAGALPEPAPTIATAAAARTVQPGTSLIRTPTGGLWALATKADGQVFQIIKGSGDWFAPHVIGGPFRSGPAATYKSSEGRVDVFAIFADGSLRRIGFAGGHWGPWVNLAGGFSGGVSVVRTPGDDLYVMAIGTNGHLYQVVRKSGRWQPRQDLGGSFSRSSSVTYYAPDNRFDIFAVGTDGRIRYRAWQRGNWGSWQAATVATNFTGVASVRVGAALKVYAVSSNRHLYEFGRLPGRSGTPRSLGGSLIGTPAAVATSSQLRVVANQTDGTLAELVWQGHWSAWKRMPGSGFPSVAPPVQTRVTLAKTLLARWGGRLTGLSGAKSDLQVTAAGRAITSCGRAVYLDPKMLAAIVKATNKYQVFVNNMVTGHSCDSGYHPLGKAVDFNTVIDPATGRRTNWHSYESGDDRALDREFLAYTAAAITSGGGAGQANCPGSATAPLPAGMLRFSDYCNHQHLDSR